MTSRLILPSMLFLFWLAVFPSAALCGEFVVFAQRNVLARASISVNFYADNQAQNNLKVAFTFRDGQLKIKCPQAWEWEKVRKAASSLAAQLDKATDFEPIAALAEAGLPGCSY